MHCNASLILLLTCAPLILANIQFFHFSFFNKNSCHKIKLWQMVRQVFYFSNFILNLILTIKLFVFVILVKSRRLSQWFWWQQVSSCGDGNHSATRGNSTKGATCENGIKEAMATRALPVARVFRVPPVVTASRALSVVMALRVPLMVML